MSNPSNLILKAQARQIITDGQAELLMGIVDLLRDEIRHPGGVDDSRESMNQTSDDARADVAPPVAEQDGAAKWAGDYAQIWFKRVNSDPRHSALTVGIASLLRSFAAEQTKGMREEVAEAQRLRQLEQTLRLAVESERDQLRQQLAEAQKPVAQPPPAVDGSDEAEKFAAGAISFVDGCLCINGEGVKMQYDRPEHQEVYRREFTRALSDLLRNFIEHLKLAAKESK